MTIPIRFKCPGLGNVFKIKTVNQVAFNIVFIGTSDCYLEPINLAVKDKYCVICVTPAQHLCSILLNLYYISS